MIVLLLAVFVVAVGNAANATPADFAAAAAAAVDDDELVNDGNCDKCAPVVSICGDFL